MPEEINRVITDHVADMLLCPTDKAVENLAQEGICESVYNVGDVMYDCALLFAAVAMEKSRILFNLELDKAGYYLATVHRQENTDCKEALSGIFGALGQLDLPVVLPLHPRTEKVLRNFAIVVPDNVRLIDPVSYLDMILLEKGARLILTDSGGIQKEAYFFAGHPCHLQLAYRYGRCGGNPAHGRGGRSRHRPIHLTISHNDMWMAFCR